MIELQYQLTPTDYIGAYYLQFKIISKRQYKYNLYCMIIWFSLFITTLKYFIFRENINFLLRYIWIFVWAYLFISLVLLPWFSYRIFSQQKTLQSERKVKIHPKYIEIVSDLMTIKMDLSEFYRYKYSRDFIVLYESDLLFHIFPRRFFKSEKDFQDFRSYLEVNLGHR